jgi:kumamolisin
MASSAGLMSLYAIGTAQAAAPVPAKTAIPQDISLAALKATPVFPVGAKTYEVVSFVLKERNGASLAAKVDQGWHGHFLTVSQFARTYGQPAARVHALEKYLHSYGLKVKAYADDLVVTASGPAGDFNKALSVKQAEYATKAIPARDGRAAQPAIRFRAATDAPLLPRGIGSYVESVLGLINYPLMKSNAIHVPVAKAAATAYSEPVNVGNRTPADFAKDYGLTPLTRKGLKGQGQTIGIITFASVRKSDPTFFWSSVLHIKTKKNRLTLEKVDYGSGPVSFNRGSSETTLDVEQSGALAPQANIVVYQAPNSDFGTIDAYATAASQNLAGTISCSWGSSETVLKVLGAQGKESNTLIQGLDELLLELSAQGQSNFTASGDQGAYAATADQGSTNVSVQNAGDSPWTTAAGGTTLPGIIPLVDQVNQSDVTLHANIRSERAWGWDWLWPFWKDFEYNASSTGTDYVPFQSEDQFIFSQYSNEIGGSTGGYSTVETRPGYQDAIKNIGSYTAVPYLKPTDYVKVAAGLNVPESYAFWDHGTGLPAAPATVKGHAYGRAVPDLSADADPYTGYLEYFVGFPASYGGSLGGALMEGWGGTSFVAPELNAAAALINEDLGHRVGLWNPAIYKFAASKHSPFTVLNASGPSNDNLYYTGSKYSIYTPGTGLGVPNLAKLAADFRRLG